MRRIPLPPAETALVMLATLQGVMLASLFAGVAPHPPATTPLFAIAPFIAAALALALGALAAPADGRARRALGALAALAALVSFGPQKFVDAQFTLIWPAVLLGQFAALAILVDAARRRRDGGAQRSARR